MCYIHYCRQTILLNAVKNIENNADNIEQCGEHYIEVYVLS